VLPVLRYLRCGAVCRVSCVEYVKRMKKLRVGKRGCCCFALLCLPYGPVHIASRLTVPPREPKRTARLRLQPRYIALHYLHLRSHCLPLTAAALCIYLPSTSLSTSRPACPPNLIWVAPKRRGLCLSSAHRPRAPRRMSSLHSLAPPLSCGTYPTLPYPPRYRRLRAGAGYPVCMNGRTARR
jgi:hypothetical protein